MDQPAPSNSVFWIDAEKIRPNPYQPRRDFDSRGLEDLADSIRQYGVLQPLTVTRHEEQTEAGLSVYYELIAGERRLRASKLAGLQQVPAIIRSGEETNKMKLELAIIENLQREDLNPIDRAYAFRQLNDEFNLTHAEIGKRMGKSREYVSNTLRLLQLPDYVQEAVRAGKMAEGHTRPLQMLRDRPEEMDTLFKEILYKKLSVREAEKIARSIAKDKLRKPPSGDPALTAYAEKFSERLGTRVMIEKTKKGKGGKIVIDFFSPDDLDDLLGALRQDGEPKDLMQQFVERTKTELAAKHDNQPAASLDQVFGKAGASTMPEASEAVSILKPPVPPSNQPAVPQPPAKPQEVNLEAYGTDFEEEDEDEDDEAIIASILQQIPTRRARQIREAERAASQPNAQPNQQDSTGELGTLMDDLADLTQE
jgi:ParB family chromosome partitioning protein